MKPKNVFLFFLLLLLASAIDNEVYGQAKKPAYRPVIRSKPDHRPVASGVRGLAPLPQTDEMVPEPEKGRGAACLMTFDNQTGYFIDVWYDAVYQGRVSPWQTDVALCIGSNYKNFTALTAGNTMEWSGKFECGGTGTFLPK